MDPIFLIDANNFPVSLFNDDAEKASTLSPAQLLESQDEYNPHTPPNAVYVQADSFETFEAQVRSRLEPLDPKVEQTVLLMSANRNLSPLATSLRTDKLRVFAWSPITDLAPLSGGLSGREKLELATSIISSFYQGPNKVPLAEVMRIFPKFVTPELQKSLGVPLTSLLASLPGVFVVKSPKSDELVVNFDREVVNFENEAVMTLGRAEVAAMLGIDANSDARRERALEKGLTLGPEHDINGITLASLDWYFHKGMGWNDESFNEQGLHSILHWILINPKFKVEGGAIMAA